ncbi:hypothetical protein C8R46DRAFT_1220322 [Mycena filopes]|nr:hypothetical protein C8R46DRAFT_1220322 [Mycena filopes]
MADNPSQPPRPASQSAGLYDKYLAYPAIDSHAARSALKVCPAIVSCNVAIPAHDDMDARTWTDQISFLRSSAPKRRKRIVLHSMSAERLFETALVSRRLYAVVEEYLVWLESYEEEDSESPDESPCFSQPEHDTVLKTSNIDVEVDVEVANSELAILAHDAPFEGTSRLGTSFTPEVRGVFTDLPAEIGLAIADELPFPDRTRLSGTSHFGHSIAAETLRSAAIRILLHFSLRFCMIRLMLTATGGAVAGSVVTTLIRVHDSFIPRHLNIVVGRGQGPYVVDFLALGPRYRLQGGPDCRNANGIHCVWTMQLGQITINVIEALSFNPLDAITFFHLSCVYGAWFANGLWHGYPALTVRGVALATPSRFPLLQRSDRLLKTWRVLNKYAERGIDVQLDEYEAPHKCGTSFDCPATLRLSDDAGCSYNRFPAWHYSAEADEAPVTCWTMGGSGCAQGILGRGGEIVWSANASTSA